MTLVVAQNIRDQLLGRGEGKYSLDTIEDYFLEAMNLMLGDQDFVSVGENVWQVEGETPITVEVFRVFHEATGQDIINRVVIVAGDNRKEERWALPPARITEKFYLDHLNAIKDYVSQCVMGSIIGEDVELDEATYKPGSVAHFLMVLTSKVIQADQRQEKADIKRGISVNIYRLGHFLKAIKDVQKGVSRVMGSTEKKDLLVLKQRISRAFTPQFSPSKFVQKAIDKYLETGALPKISGKRGTKPPWEEVDVEHDDVELDEGLAKAPWEKGGPSYEKLGYTVLAKVKGVFKTDNEQAAKRVAREKELSYGLSIYGSWYIGRPYQLKKLGVPRWQIREDVSSLRKRDGVSLFVGEGIDLDEAIQWKKKKQPVTGLDKFVAGDVRNKMVLSPALAGDGRMKGWRLQFPSGVVINHHIDVSDSHGAKRWAEKIIATRREDVELGDTGSVGDIQLMRDELLGDIDEACKTPGMKKRSKGKGRGLAKGKGRGPLGIPIGDKVELEDVEMNEAKELSHREVEKIITSYASELLPLFADKWSRWPQGQAAREIYNVLMKKHKFYSSSKMSKEAGDIKNVARTILKRGGIKEDVGLDEARRRKKMTPRVDPDIKKIRPGTVPKEITLFGGKKHAVDPKAWKHFVKEAKKNKKWAEDHEYAKNPDEWPASGISKDMLKERLRKSVEQLALDSYRYAYMRSHGVAKAWGSNMALDPAAKRNWEKITGKKIEIPMDPAEKKVLDALRKKRRNEGVDVSGLRDDLLECGCEDELDEAKGFTKGQRVSTPLGPGDVAYQRMGPPNYSEPVSVSVVIDKKRNKPGYTGTMFKAKDVKPLKEDVELDEGMTKHTVFKFGSLDDLWDAHDALREAGMNVSRWTGGWNTGMRGPIAAWVHQKSKTLAFGSPSVASEAKKILSAKKIKIAKEFKEDVELDEGDSNYARSELGYLKKGEIWSIQIRDDSGGATKWMDINKEVISALKGKGRGTYAAKEMGRLKKGEIWSMQIRDDSGGATKWMNVSPGRIKALISIWSKQGQREDVELDEANRGLKSQANSILVTAQEMETDPDYLSRKPVLVKPYAENMRGHVKELLARSRDPLVEDIANSISQIRQKMEKMARYSGGRIPAERFSEFFIKLKAQAKGILSALRSKSVAEGILDEAKKTYVVNVKKYFRGITDRGAVVKARSEKEAIAKAAKQLGKKPSYLEIENVYEDVEMNEGETLFISPTKEGNKKWQILHSTSGMVGTGGQIIKIGGKKEIKALAAKLAKKWKAEVKELAGEDIEMEAGDEIHALRDELLGGVDEACKTPGMKKRSKGKGRGLAKGKGRGPLGIPVDELEDIELDEGRKVKQFELGDIVRHTKKFLRNTGQYTGVPRSGKVVGFIDLAGKKLPRVKWDDGNEAPIQPENIEIHPRHRRRIEDVELDEAKTIAQFDPVKVGTKVKLVRGLFDMEKDLLRKKNVHFTFVRWAKPHGHAVVKDSSGANWHVHPESLILAEDVELDEATPAGGAVALKAIAALMKDFQYAPKESNKYYAAFVYRGRGGNQSRILAKAESALADAGFDEASFGTSGAGLMAETRRGKVWVNIYLPGLRTEDVELDEAGVTGYSIMQLYNILARTVKKGTVKEIEMIHNELKAKGADMHLVDLIIRSGGKLPGRVKKIASLSEMRNELLGS